MIDKKPAKQLPKVRATRKSTSTEASSGTTFVRVPPRITPGFTVRPFVKSVNPAITSICGSATTACSVKALPLQVWQTRQ